MKITDKQKQVIRRMRQGEILRKTRFIGYTAVFIGEGCTPNNDVNKNTFNGLWSKGIIEYANNKEFGRTSSQFILTELGKTIQID